MLYDVIILGGGPSGLSAALALGRARKHVLLCDAGPRRNAAAERVHNFVTRDGTPPDEFRAVARQQLREYPNVEVRDVRVEAIRGAKGDFSITLDGGESVSARRVLLCTGMIDETLPIEGFRELWGHSIFQCPYCHGWEARERRWGYLATPAAVAHLLPFALQLRSWSRDVTVFTHAAVTLPEETHATLVASGISVETAPIARLIAEAGKLAAVELGDGRRVEREVLFAHPPQRQTALVQSLDLTLDADSFVQVDAMRRETSMPGVYAAGDLCTRMQAAVQAAATGMQAAAAINLELSLELVASGAL